MCVALIISGDSSIAVADLERMDNDNPHGAGVAFLDVESGRIRIRKGLTVKELAWLQPDLPRPFLMHFRWATIGPKVPRLSHPFALGHDAFNDALDQLCDAALIHNGGWGDWRKWILPDGVKDSEVSDTQVAAYVIGAGHPEVRKDVSWSNAIISLDKAGNPVVTEHGRWMDIPGYKGIQASNLSWQTRARGNYTYESPYGEYIQAVWKYGKMVSGGYFRRKDGSTVGNVPTYKGATFANQPPVASARSQSYYDNWDQDVTPTGRFIAPPASSLPPRYTHPNPGKVYDLRAGKVVNANTAPLMDGLVATGVHSGHVKPAHPIDRRTILSAYGKFHTPWGTGNPAPAGASPCAECTYYSCLCGYSPETRMMMASRRASGLDPDRGAPTDKPTTTERERFLLANPDEPTETERKIALGYLPINLDLTPLTEDVPSDEAQPKVTRNAAHKARKQAIASNRTARRRIRKEAEKAIKAIKDCPENTARMIRQIAEREIVKMGFSAPVKSDDHGYVVPNVRPLAVAAPAPAPAYRDRGCTAEICYCPGMEACVESRRLLAMSEASDGEPITVEIDALDEIIYRDPVREADSYTSEFDRVQRALGPAQDYGNDDGALTFSEDDRGIMDPEYGRGAETWEFGGEG